MCLAIPGKIVAIDGKKATIEYSVGNRIAYLDPSLPVVIGDYVIVQMMTVMQKITEEEALSSLEAWKEATDKSKAE